MAMELPSRSKEIDHRTGCMTLVCILLDRPWKPSPQPQDYRRFSGGGGRALTLLLLLPYTCHRVRATAHQNATTALFLTGTSSMPVRHCHQPAMHLEAALRRSKRSVRYAQLVLGRSLDKL